MMKHMTNYIFLILLFISGIFLSCTNTKKLHDQEIDYVSKVNTLIGSDSEFNLSNGNTYPFGIARAKEEDRQINFAPGIYIALLIHKLY